MGELEQATHALADLTNRVRAGETRFVGHLAAALRALVYWNERKTMDPLLLRLAARIDASLPIYTLRDVAMPHQDGLVSDVNPGLPSILRRLPTQTISDIQDWLESIVFSYRPTGSDATELRRLSAKDAIAGVADTLGVAHYDQDVPIDVETLSQFYGPHTDALTHVLLSAASVVVPLSLYLQDRLAETEEGALQSGRGQSTYSGASNKHSISFTKDFNAFAKRRGVTRAVAEAVFQEPDLTHMFGEDDSETPAGSLKFVHVRRNVDATNGVRYGIMVTGVRKNQPRGEVFMIDGAWRLYHDVIDITALRSARDTLRAFAERYGLLVRVGDRVGRYLEDVSVRPLPNGSMPVLSFAEPLARDAGGVVEAVAQQRDNPRRLHITVAYGVNEGAYSTDLRRHGFVGRI